MKKIVFIVFVLIQMSCSKSNIAPSGDSDSPDTSVSDKYEVIDILFDGKSASIEEIREVKPSLTYKNATGSVQKIVIEPQPIFETSIFTPETDLTYTIVDSTKFISVPQYVSKSEISLSKKKWTYSENEIKLPTELTLRDSVNVEPGKELKASLAVVFNKIKSNYSLKLRNLQTKEIVTVKGEWVGIVPNRMETSVNLTE